ncbi:uncharacterized protein ZBAI_09717 [Zygosaccharomyces bailii ISA1307]|nr:uncharacterized protein ZBAI_09717 [Zygosaccharomyces bailii ISA1307]
MVKIIYGHSADHFKQLKVAGDFTSWGIKPMKKNAEFWEYTFQKGNLAQDAKVIHFKFIDDNGVWFTDDDYAKETDSNNNENNVRILTREELEELGEVVPSKEQSYDMGDEGPVRPAPTPRIDDGGATPAEHESEGKSRNASQELGESTVIVNHSDAQEAENRPGTSGTVYSQAPEATQYKTVLARVIAFFSNLFRSWFSHRSN